LAHAIMKAATASGNQPPRDKDRARMSTPCRMADAIAKECS
jgi:hypothetical protein